jgi:hypothetical protein
VGEDGPDTCAGVSRAFAEEPAGTASRQTAWLLVEQEGAWGPTALRDSRLDGEVAAELDRRHRLAHVRILLIRRGPGEKRPGRRQWIFVRSTTRDPHLGGGHFDDERELLGLDLAGMATGEVPLPPELREPVVAVCTHGRHDRCCADYGRPVARALRAAGADAWECSHIGGDRFAANLVAFPHGLYWGRVTPEAAPAIVAGYLAGRIAPDGFRGRTSLRPPEQWSEIHLRRALDAWGVDDLTFVGSDVDGDLVTVRFHTAGGDEHEIQVRVDRDERPRLLTCRSGNIGGVRRILPVTPG